MLRDRLSLTPQRSSIHARPASDVTHQGLFLTTEQATITFAELGLREEIQRAIADAGYVHPTPIQAAAIPAVLDGRDVVGIA
ncbi:MAG: DEAD/DEAH box helicase, partial [Geminicoccaceae bacterium]|nr:DEAD/DEAH box helicase [Geminicoccaceae bacterium]